MALSMEQILANLEEAKRSLDESVKKVEETVKDASGNDRIKLRTEVDSAKMAEAKSLMDGIISEFEILDLSPEEISNLKRALASFSAVAQRNSGNTIVQKVLKGDTVLDDMVSSLQPVIQQLTRVDDAVNELYHRGYDIKKHIEYENKNIKRHEENIENYYGNIDVIEKMQAEFGIIFEMYELEKKLSELLEEMEEKKGELSTVISDLNSSSLSDDEKLELEKNKDELIKSIKELGKDYVDVIDSINHLKKDRSKMKHVDSDIVMFCKNPEKNVDINIKWVDLESNVKGEITKLENEFYRKLDQIKKMSEIPKPIKDFMDKYGYYDLSQLKFDYIANVKENELNDINEEKKCIEAIKETIAKLEEIERVTPKKKNNNKNKDSDNTNAKKKDAKLSKKEKEEIKRIFDEMFKREQRLLAKYDGKRMNNATVEELKKALTDTVYKDKKHPEFWAKIGTWSIFRKKSLKRVKKAYKKKASEKYASNLKEAKKAKKEKAKTMAEKYKVDVLKNIKLESKFPGKINTKYIEEWRYEDLDKDL